MSRYLLDSDAVIDLLNGFVPSVATIDDLAAGGHELCTCAAVAAEIFAGMFPGESQRADLLFDDLTFLEPDLAAAKQAGGWRYASARTGRQLAAFDALIAATALHHDAIVVTGNVRDFALTEVAVLPLPR